MNEALKATLKSIKEVQAKRRRNWEDEEHPRFQEREILHLTQLDVLKRQVESIKNGTYQAP